MKTIEAYETSDGTIFACEDKALAHQENVIGEMLDGLVPHDERGHMTRIDRHNLLIKMLGDTKLKAKILELHKALEHG